VSESTQDLGEHPCPPSVRRLRFRPHLEPLEDRTPTSFNWNLGTFPVQHAVPGPGDDASFNTPFSVILNGSATVRSLNGGNRLIQTAGTLTVTGGGSILTELDQSGGATVQVQGNGTFFQIGDRSAIAGTLTRRTCRSEQYPASAAITPGRPPCRESADLADALLEYAVIIQRRSRTLRRGPSADYTGR
jgi:hypothetical protein